MSLERVRVNFTRLCDVTAVATVHTCLQVLPQDRQSTMPCLSRGANDPTDPENVTHQQLAAVDQRARDRYPDLPGRDMRQPDVASSCCQS
jgi:hypothetical protein